MLSETHRMIYLALATIKYKYPRHKSTHANNLIFDVCTRSKVQAYSRHGRCIAGDNAPEGSWHWFVADSHTKEAVLDRCAVVHPSYARQTGRPPSPDRVRDNGRNSSRAPRGRRRAGIGPGCELLDGTESSSPARARGRDPRQATILPSVLTRW
jgi:hypothetical protein